MPRAYIGNIIYTVLGEPFNEWVKGQIHKRNEARKEERSMQIALDPEILKLFQASTSVSLSKGTSNHSKYSCEDIVNILN